MWTGRRTACRRDALAVGAHQGFAGDLSVAMETIRGRLYVLTEPVIQASLNKGNPLNTLVRVTFSEWVFHKDRIYSSY